MIGRQEAAVWQQYLNERFPSGVQINYVEFDGSLRFPSRMLPAVVVMDLMSNGFPVLMGFDYLQQMSYDLQIFPESWEKIDRQGHFVVRVTQVDGPAIEMSSWIPEDMATEMHSERTRTLKELTEASIVLAPREGESLSPIEPGTVPAAIRDVS